MRKARRRLIIMGWAGYGRKGSTRNALIQDATGAHLDDFYVDLSDITIPWASVDEIWLRKTDADNTLKLQFYSTGAVRLINRLSGVDTTIFNLPASTVSTGDTIRLTCEANEAWLTVNSVATDYSDQLTVTTGTAYLIDDINNGLNADEVTYGAA